MKTAAERARVAYQKWRDDPRYKRPYARVCTEARVAFVAGWKARHQERRPKGGQG